MRKKDKLPYIIDDETFNDYLNLVRRSKKVNIPFLELGHRIIISRENAITLVDVFFDEKLFGVSASTADICNFIFGVLVSLHKVRDIAPVVNRIFDKLKENENVIKSIDVFRFSDMKMLACYNYIPHKNISTSVISSKYDEIAAKRYSEFNIKLLHKDLEELALSNSEYISKPYTYADRFNAVLSIIKRYDNRLMLDQYYIKSNLYDVHINTKGEDDE